MNGGATRGWRRWIRRHGARSRVRQTPTPTPPPSAVAAGLDSLVSKKRAELVPFLSGVNLFAEHTNEYHRALIADAAKVKRPPPPLPYPSLPSPLSSAPPPSFRPRPTFHAPGPP